MGGKPQYVMAIDVGTGAGRCFVCSLDGTVIRQRYQEWSYRPVPEARPGGLDFDPAEFWGILSGLVRRTLTECDLRPESIVAVSSTSQREGIVLLDRQGHELYGGPNIDQRAPSDAAVFEARFGQRLHHHSGHGRSRCSPPTACCGSASTSPDLLDRSATMLLLNDWVLYRLSGEAASEPSNGDETLLFDLHTRTWVPGPVGGTRPARSPVATSAAVRGAAGQRHGRGCRSHRPASRYTGRHGRRRHAVRLARDGRHSSGRCRGCAWHIRAGDAGGRPAGDWRPAPGMERLPCRRRAVRPGEHQHGGGPDFPLGPRSVLQR